MFMCDRVVFPCATVLMVLLFRCPLIETLAGAHDDDVLQVVLGLVDDVLLFGELLREPLANDLAVLRGQASTG